MRTASALGLALSVAVAFWIAASSLADRQAAFADDDPSIEVWFEEGCDRTYAIGDYLHLRYRSNVDGMARVWRYPDQELFLQQWMAAEVIYEIEGPVTGPAGQWWILGELLDAEASGTCYYTTTLALPTPTSVATAGVTATATAGVTATATAGVTATATAGATKTPSPTSTPRALTATFTPSPQSTATSSSSTSTPTAGVVSDVWMPLVSRSRPAD